MMVTRMPACSDAAIAAYNAAAAAAKAANKEAPPACIPDNDPRPITATDVTPYMASMEYKIIRDFTTAACMNLPVRGEYGA